VLDKRRFEITWPNVVRVDHVYTPTLTLDLDRVDVLEIDASQTVTLAELAPVIEGKPDLSRVTEIGTGRLGRKFPSAENRLRVGGRSLRADEPTWKEGASTYWPNWWGWWNASCVPIGSAYSPPYSTKIRSVGESSWTLNMIAS